MPSPPSCPLRLVVGASNYFKRKPLIFTACRFVALLCRGGVVEEESRGQEAGCVCVLLGGGVVVLRISVLHGGASLLSPVPGCGGTDLLQADMFDLHCLQVRVGV